MLNSYATLGKDLPTAALPFSDRKQQSVVGWLVREDRFFKQCVGRLTQQFFVNPNAQKLVEAMLAFHAQHQRRPRLEELAEAPSVKPEDPATKASLRAYLQECVEASAVFGLDVLEKELTEWLQARGYQGMLETSVKLYNQQNLAEAIGHVVTRVREIQDIRFVADLEISPDDYGQIFERREVEKEDAATFGLAAMDRLLQPEGKSGGLLRRNMTILLGTINSGKTRCMASIVRHNALKGKSSLFLMHEGNYEDVYADLWVSLITRPETGGFVTRKILTEQLYRSAGGRQIIERAREVWKNNICFMPMIKAGMTVEEVVTTIRRKQDEWAASHGGRGFDLVVDDYPALLRTVEGARGELARREKDHLVYLQFNQLAAELDLHAVVAIQSNREGSKAVRGRGEHRKGEKVRRRLLTREDFEEAWGPAETATNIITINRDQEMEHDGHVIFYLDKSRSSQTGWAVVARSEYGSCLTHDDALGACWYAGTGSYTRMLRTFLEQYPGQQVPTALLVGAHNNE